MQIEFEELRKQLTAITQPGKFGPNAGKLDEVFWSIDELSKFAGDGTNLLERMQNRIANGEKWDVREAFDPDSGKWRVVDDSNKSIQKRVTENGILVGTENSGKVVPTVREQLERQSQVILMDAKSAADGAELIENQINRVQKYRENFAEYCAAYEKDPTSGPSLDQLFRWRHEFLENNPVKSLGGQIGGQRPELVFGSTGTMEDGRVFEMFPDNAPAFYIKYGEIRADVRSDFSLEAESDAKQIKNNPVALSLYYRNNILSEAPLNTIAS
jgi:hypothetical protein